MPRCEFEDCQNPGNRQLVLYSVNERPWICAFHLLQLDPEERQRFDVHPAHD